VIGFLSLIELNDVLDVANIQRKLLLFQSITLDLIQKKKFSTLLSTKLLTLSQVANTDMMTFGRQSASKSVQNPNDATIQMSLLCLKDDGRQRAVVALKPSINTEDPKI
jgi:hypothetical protein